MKLRNLTRWGGAAVLALLLVACGGGGTDKGTQPPADTLKTAVPGNAVLNVEGKLFSVPSPVQMAMLIRKLGVAYGTSLPLAPEQAEKFTSAKQKALALGMYGADLAYVTVHKDGQRALKIIRAVEKLGGDLNVANAFDRGLLDRFKTNLGNEDSLLRLGGAAFRSVDMYLKGDQRSDVSALVLAGGWVESMYLALGNEGDKVDPKLTARIADQRHALENLVALLKQTGADPALADSLADLASSFQGVRYAYTYAQPTVDAPNKTTYINSVTSADMPKSTLEEVIRKVRALRASITA